MKFKVGDRVYVIPKDMEGEVKAINEGWIAIELDGG
mgnify:CR=1 FL=1